MSYAFYPTKEGQRDLIIFGDAAVGKTSLRIVFKDGIFPEAHASFLWDNSVTSIEVKHQRVQLVIWDGFDRGLDRLLTTRIHASLLCFSVDNPDSLKSIEDSWINKLRDFTGGSVPVYLVGCKIDLRTDLQTHTQLAAGRQKVVTTAQGEKIAKKIGARAYLECSSKTGEGVKHVFHHVLNTMDDKTVPPEDAKQIQRRVSEKAGCIVM